MTAARVVLSSTLLLLAAGCGAPDLMMWVSRVERRGPEAAVTIKLAAVGADGQPGRGRVELEVTGAEVNSAFVELDGDGLGAFEVRHAAGQQASVRASWDGVNAILEGNLKPAPSTGSSGSSSSSVLPMTSDAGASVTPAPVPQRPEPVVPEASCSSSAGVFPGFPAVVVVLNRNGTPARSSVVVSRGRSMACAVTDASGRARFSNLGAGAWQATVNTVLMEHTTIDNGPYEPSISIPSTLYASVPYRIVISDTNPTNVFELQSRF